MNWVASGSESALILRAKQNQINFPTEDTDLAVLDSLQCPPEEILQSYLNRTLSKRDRRQLAAHLKVCSVCWQKIRNMREAQLLTYEAEVFNQMLEELDASDSGSLEYLLQARQEQRHYQKLPGLWLIWRLRLRRWWRRFR